MQEIKNIINSPRIKFVKGDIINHKTYSSIFRNTDLEVNVATESHVDNSWQVPLSFSHTNTLSAHTFSLKCIEIKFKKIIHISKDEVYGEKIKGSYSENDKLSFHFLF